MPVLLMTLSRALLVQKQKSPDTNGLKNMMESQAVVAHACNPSTLARRGRQISEFEASLVYKVSSRTARATQRNPVSEKKKKKEKKKKTNIK